MANEIPDFLVRIDEFGVLDSLLPFMLIFTILFAVLQKTKIIGEGKRQFNTLVSLIVTLMVVLPHVTGKYPPGQDVVVIINQAMPQVSLIVVVILAILLLIGVFAPGTMMSSTGFGGILALFSVIAIVYIFGNAAGIWETTGMLSFLNDPDTQAVITIVVVFALIIWFVTKDDGKEGGIARSAEGFRDFFLGGKH